MIYLYETIPTSGEDEVRRFEIKQSIHDKALDRHPETGEAIRRVILGGLGIITGKSARPNPPPSTPPRQGCCCGSGGCGHR